MTNNARAGTRTLGSLRSADGKGVVRTEDRYDTDIDDLWSAVTDPRRLARGPHAPDPERSPVLVAGDRLDARDGAASQERKQLVP